MCGDLAMFIYGAHYRFVCVCAYKSVLCMYVCDPPYRGAMCRKNEDEEEIRGKADKKPKRGGIALRLV